MKRLFTAICILVCSLFIFASCENNDGYEIETYLVTEEPATNEAGEVITTEIEETEYFTDENGDVVIYNEDGETEYVTIVAPSLDEMSPKKMDVTLPYEFDYQLTEVKSLLELDPEYSIYPETSADKVYINGNRQYFYYESGEMAVITLKEDKSTYACYYNSEGTIQFCSDDILSWYFDSDNNIEHIVYTYYNAYTTRNVYTFYSTEGERLYIAVDGIYYDSDFNVLSGEEYDRFVIEYADTQEILADG